MKGAVVFNSVVDRLSQTARNLEAIQEAKKKRQQEDELFGLKKKEAELNLKKMELTGQADEQMAQLYKYQTEQQLKQLQDINKGKDAQISMAEQENKQKLQHYGEFARTIYENDPMVKSHVNQTVSGAGRGMMDGFERSLPPSMAIPQGQPQAPQQPAQQPQQAPSVFEQPITPTVERSGDGFALKTPDLKTGYEEAIARKRQQGIPLTREEQEFFSKNVTGSSSIGSEYEDVLSDEQLLQGRALAKEIYGARGIEAGLPAIYKEMASGKSVEKIQDSLRYSGQSGKMSGDFRSAAQNLTMGKGKEVRQDILDNIDDALTSGNMEQAKDKLKIAARKLAPADQQVAMGGKERTLKFLDEIENDLAAIEQAGVDTNIFSGTAEDMARKVGTIREPELNKVATKIALGIQSYRKAISGAAFTAQESEEYKNVFPQIGRTGEFNTNSINALRETFTGELDNFYANAIGEEEYGRLFKTQSGPKTVVMTDANGNQAEVEVDESGNPVRVVREL